MIGRSRGGPTTKVHAVVDAPSRRSLANPVRIVLTPGQAHEMTVARELLAPIHDAYVTADSAYSSASLIKELEQRGCEAVVANNPTHRRRNLDAHLYRERFLVEAFFQKLKRYRRVAMRFEKLAKNFLACVQLAMRAPRVHAPLMVGSAASRFRPRATRAPVRGCHPSTPVVVNRRP